MMKNKSQFRSGRGAKRFGQQQRPLQNVSPTRSPELASAFSQALALHQAGRLAEAETIYRQILKVQPNHFDSLHLLGVIYHQRGNHAEAVRQIDAALKINPKDASALSNRGLALQELKRLDEALASYDKALALKPDYAEAFNNRGIALQEVNRLDEALASYDKAMALKSDYAEAHFNRSLALLLKGHYADGWEEYEWRWKGGAKGVKPRRVPAVAGRGFNWQDDFPPRRARIRRHDSVPALRAAGNVARPFGHPRGAAIAGAFGGSRSQRRVLLRRRQIPLRRRPISSARY